MKRLKLQHHKKTLPRLHFSLRIAWICLTASGCLLINSCKTTQPGLNVVDVASLYNPGSSTLHPEYYLYHETDSTSLLYIKVFPGELLYNQANEKNIYQAKFRMKYSIYESFETRNLLDSGSSEFTLPRKNMRQSLITYKTLKLKNKKEYLIIVTAMDVLRGTSKKNIIPADRKHPYPTEDFIVKEPFNNRPVLKNYLPNIDTFCITTRHKNIHSWTIDYYKNNFRMPPPPFANVRIDSLSIIPDSNLVFHDSLNCHFSLPYKGLYMFRPQKANSGGIAVTRFYDEFPYLKKPAHLIGPLKYLTTRREYEQIMKYDNPKLAVDDFWLKKTKSANQARELIRILYNRVQYANAYFTNHTEGWKTDRGMIYTVFGPPITIYKDEKKETWIYRDMKTFKTIKFEFMYIENPFSKNHFVLKRNVAFKTPWYRAVETWREGRVYSSAE